MGVYTQTSWVNGTTPLSQTNLNNLETQYADATTAFNQDLFAAGYVLYGMVCSKDASTTTQLDITAGVAYVLQSDNTLARITVAATNEATVTHSTTYYLYLQPAGTLYWNTANTPAANSIAICQVTTDSSGNVSTVSDKRNVSPTVFPQLTNHDYTPGLFSLPAPFGCNLTQNPTLVGTVNGGVTYGQAGAIPNSYETGALFNGTSGYISCPTTGLPTSGSFSVECWASIAANPAGTAVLVNIGNPGGSSDQLYIAMNTSGQIRGGCGGTDTGSSGSLSTNAWHHCVATYDGTNIRCYLDGSLTGGPTANSDTLVYGVMSIGQLGNASLYFPGKLAHVAMYGSALSAARVTAHYNAGLSQTATAYASTVLADSPLRYYKLADATGSTSAIDTITSTGTQLVDAGGNINTSGSVTTSGTVTAAGAVIGHYGVNAVGDLIDTSGNGTGAGGTTTVFFKSGTGGWTYQSPNGTNVASMNSSGAFTEIGGQATAGSFGVSTIIAQALNSTQTGSGSRNVLNPAPPANGLYRISGYAEAKHSDGAHAITAGVSYADDNGGPTVYMVTQGASGTPVMMNGTNTFSTAASFNFMPITIYAKTGTNITCFWNNSDASATDSVWFIIERLA